MSAAGAGQSAITLAAAIERYFQVSLYLLVLTGFGTLAGTGTLDAPTVVLVGSALLVRGYLLSKRSDYQMPTRWTNYLTLGYFVFFLADYTLLSRSFLTATVHLVLFGMVVRLFSVHKERDNYMLAVLAFLMVLAAAVLTVDSVFLFTFAGFMLTAVVTFVLMEMRRSSQTASIPAREPSDRMTYRRMGFFLAGISPVLVALILAGGSAIFFLLPRMSAGYLGSFAGGNDMTTGFSDRVQLGRIGQIQQSTAVVMHVQIDGDTRGSYDLKWRGVALSRFDGKIWSNPTEQFPLPRAADGRFVLWNASAASPVGGPPNIPGRAEAGSARLASPKATRPIHYRVLMEPIGTNLFFLASRPRFLKGVYRILATDRAGAVYNLDANHPVGLYEADSDLAEPSARELASASVPVAPEMREYLQVPTLDERIPELARQITASASNPFDRAAALERYLMSRFGYTLELPRVSPQDPIADFLFVRKRGHCEYFASSMAIMLRTLGIPSRVVNGFRTTEFNDLTGNYVIRASSAHSWVEAYFPNYGWISFDPTPGTALGGATGWARLGLYVDAMASFWREWIVDYDASHQKTLGEDALRGSRSVIDGMRDWAQGHYAAMLERARHTQQKFLNAPRRWGTSGVLLCLLVLAIANIRTLLRWLRERKLASHPEEAPSLAAALWYQRMLRWLDRKGCKKSAMQTPKEFLTGIEDPVMRRRVEDFTRAYEAARFGESSEEARRLPELYEELITTERK
jgi:protein-glutamine gamma-glutamyltransferase